MSAPPTRDVSFDEEVEATYQLLRTGLCSHHPNIEQHITATEEASLFGTEKTEIDNVIENSGALYGMQSQEGSNGLLSTDKLDTAPLDMAVAYLKWLKTELNERRIAAEKQMSGPDVEVLVAVKACLNTKMCWAYSMAIGHRLYHYENRKAIRDAFASQPLMQQKVSNVTKDDAVKVEQEHIGGGTNA